MIAVLTLLILLNLYFETYFDSTKQTLSALALVIALEFLILWLLSFENIATNKLSLNGVEVYTGFGLSISVCFRLLQNICSLNKNAGVAAVYKRQKYVSLKTASRFLYEIQVFMNQLYEIEKNPKKKQLVDLGISVGSLKIIHKKFCTKVTCYCQKMDLKISKNKGSDEIKKVAFYAYLVTKEAYNVKKKNNNVVEV